MLSKIICLFMGHSRLKELKNDEHAPFGVGSKDGSYYPMWPCERCNSMYIEKIKLKTKEMFVQGELVIINDD